MVVDEGTIWTPETLQKIDAITKSLDGWDYDARVDERKHARERLEKEGKLTQGRDQRASSIGRFPPYPVNHDAGALDHAPVDARRRQMEKDGHDLRASS